MAIFWRRRPDVDALYFISRVLATLRWKHCLVEELELRRDTLSAGGGGGGCHSEEFNFACGGAYVLHHYDSRAYDVADDIVFSS